jgi:uncharacterized protein with HEPN domain
MPSTPSRTEITLRDVLENIRLARSFVAGFSFSDFQADQRTSYAVIRCLEIISEASRRLPPDLKAHHPEIPWANIAGAGSIYRHQYDGVRDDFVWNTIQHELEPLRIVIEQELGKTTQ